MEQKEQDDFEQGLREVQVLSHEQLILGLPSKIFGGGLALSVAFMFILPWYIGVIFGVIYFFAMYTIHEKDSRAIIAWRRALTKRSNYWSAGQIKRKRFIVIDIE
jgi:hypothetical protein